MLIMTKMTKTDKKTPSSSPSGDDLAPPQVQKTVIDAETKDPVERGGPKGPEPTRFGDWESGGRCTDF